MFTGIITDIGRVRDIARLPGRDTRLVIETNFPTGDVALGASVACSGVCLTVVERLNDALAFEASAETEARTTLGAWAPGTPINLERSLKLGDELGGHLVYGHVDGLATVISSTPEGDSTRWVFEVPDDLARFIASKGSVSINGVSLTVNEVDGRRFGVNIIPHTAKQTTFGTLKVGDQVNLEVDMLARYMARLVAYGNPAVPA